MWESLVDGEEAERADMLLVWLLTPLVTSHGVVGLAGLGAGPVRGVYFAGGFVTVLAGPAHSPGCGGCRERGRCWVPDKGSVER